MSGSSWYNDFDTKKKHKEAAKTTKADRYGFDWPDTHRRVLDAHWDEHRHCDLPTVRSEWSKIRFLVSAEDAGLADILIGTRITHVEDGLIVLARVKQDTCAAISEARRELLEEVVNYYFATGHIRIRVVSPVEQDSYLGTVLQLFGGDVIDQSYPGSQHMGRIILEGTREQWEYARHLVKEPAEKKRGWKGITERRTWRVMSHVLLACWLDTIGMAHGISLSAGADGVDSERIFDIADLPIRLLVTEPRHVHAYVPVSEAGLPLFYLPVVWRSYPEDTFQMEVFRPLTRTEVERTWSFVAAESEPGIKEDFFRRPIAALAPLDTPQGLLSVPVTNTIRRDVTGGWPKVMADIAKVSPKMGEFLTGTKLVNIVELPQGGERGLLVFSEDEACRAVKGKEGAEALIERRLEHHLGRKISLYCTCTEPRRDRNLLIEQINQFSSTLTPPKKEKEPVHA